MTSKEALTMLLASYNYNEARKRRKIKRNKEEKR